jgi:6-pyruvoyl-tetrahydropterin synthase
VEAEGKPGKNGMVMDFAEFKRIVGDHLNRCFDHKLIVNYRSFKETVGLEKEGLSRIKIPQSGIDLIAPSESIFLFTYDPTSENLAKSIYADLAVLLKPLKVVSVRVHEGENNYAQYP